MDKINARLLIVDDDTDILLAAKMFLRQHISIVHIEKKSSKTFPTSLTMKL